MIFQLDIKKQSIKIEGEIFTSSHFVGDSIPSFASKSDFHHELFIFLKDWFSDSEYISVKTSGSTGTPQEMLVQKVRMMQSAVLTCSFLKLKANDTALLCMSVKYIAGMMLVVRSLVAQLDLYAIAPTGNPLSDSEIQFDFAAMVPLQVFNSLQNEIEKNRLRNIQNLIIGGGAIDTEIESILKNFPNNVYSTYGMTETLSHIALRKLNGENATQNYIPFQSVNISLSSENTLVIDAPLVSLNVLITNDIAKIHSDGSFTILGRKDNVVNSGGIKIQIEEVEKIYAPHISIPFAVSSIADAKFGEVLTLVAEREINLNFLENIEPSYLRAKHFVKVDKIPMTETSKTDRASLKMLLSVM